MKLYLMRHGAAEDAASSFHDFDRALTSKGRKRTRDVARALHRAGESPHLILASPLVRALQSAEIAAAVIDPEEPVGVRQEIAPNGDIMTLVHELAESQRKSVMLVGHEPSLSTLVDQLLGGNIWDKPLQKSMVVGLKIDETGHGKLRFVLDPKTFALQAKDAAAAPKT